MEVSIECIAERPWPLWDAFKPREDMMAHYQVIVGNIGTVYSGPHLPTARIQYNEYVSQSRDNYGRAAGESVVLLTDDEICDEYDGTISEE